MLLSACFQSASCRLEHWLYSIFYYSANWVVLKSIYLSALYIKLWAYWRQGRCFISLGIPLSSSGSGIEFVLDIWLFSQMICTVFFTLDSFPGTDKTKSGVKEASWFAEVIRWHRHLVPCSFSPQLSITVWWQLLDPRTNGTISPWHTTLLQPWAKERHFTTQSPVCVWIWISICNQAEGLWF